MRRFTRVGAALALALGLAAGPVATAPAAAHGGPIDVDLGTDGAGGISASLTWASDGHPVEESAVVVVRAVSGTGEQVGPVRLSSASEGVGWYRSEPRLLDEGHWTVTARVKEPEKAKVETELDVAAPPTPEPSEPAEAPATGADDAATGSSDDPPAAADGADAAGGTDMAARAERDDASPAAGLAGWAGWVAGALVVAAAVVAAVVLRRRTT